MCGITAYKGKGDASFVVMEALKKLEYRGYDSWGIASLGAEGIIETVKNVGKISSHTETGLRQSSVAIGHTRWATHGGVSERNTHPHFDCGNEIAVIHNGIIENFDELRRELGGRGHEFRSETDTEVIAHLIEEFSSLGLKEAVRKAMERVKGRSAVIAIKKGYDGFVAARTGSPLIVGIGENEYFVSSDIPAFLDHTKNVMYLDDDEMVVVEKKPVFYSLKSGGLVEKRLITIDWSADQAEKGEFEHFMIKEIMEQKDTILRAINQNDSEIQKIANEINSSFGTFFTGCGTAGKVCFTGQYIFSKIANKHVNYVNSSEFPNYEHFLRPETLLITVSQSGETADVLEAVKTAKKKGVKIISLVNVKGSTLDRQSDHTFLINAGPEKAVASTKATTAQLAILYLLAYATTGKIHEGKNLLLETASKVNDMLNPRYLARIEELAKIICKKSDIYIIGRGLNYPMALESAIKVQEVSYIHGHGFAGGELKHGPLALIEKGTPCIVLTAKDDVFPQIIGNAMEVKARGGYIIGIGPEKHGVFDYWIKTPDVREASPIVNIIPVQLLAYYLGVLRGCEIDYPRNLAKSVTVQ
ncbi:MAG: glutamine--fructose-6-phosphate transaminase (isomerizing) [Candidatus Aenigmarchaeota archaeon]|nr:glutamine--fructose-6-phosphate transaminase (isomerizing) [Candidatus Aenigmarchaeota archaeon]